MRTTSWKAGLWIALALASAGCRKGEDDGRARPPAKSPQPPAEAGQPEPTPPGYDGEALGALSFDVSGGSPQARRHFVRGLLALHSFWYEEAADQFQSAIAADKEFAMAYWGLAMSKSKLLWGDDDLRGGRDALRRMPPSSRLPPREKAWVQAAAALFRSGNVRQSRKDFAAAMEQIHARFPDDESATFLALALLSAFRPEDPAGLPARKRAAELAMDVFRRNPKHPGAAHYLIHALDTPELAHEALPAATLYATIAPEAFHARHMPAHIFARLGMWKEAVTSCQSAWDASVTWAKKKGLSADHHDFHSLNWIIEIEFERGRRAAADEAMALYGAAVKAGLNHQTRSGYANQVSSYMARTGEWARVDELLAPLEAPAADTRGGGTEACGAHPPMPGQPPLAGLERRAALTARIRSAAMRRDPAQTRRLMSERAALDAELQPFFDATQPPDLVARMVADRETSDKAMIARATGDDKTRLETLAQLAEATKDEFAAEGAAGGNLATEEIADTLLRLERYKEARAAYDRVLTQHVGRAHALLGAARAARSAGDAAGARGYYERLLKVWVDADANTEGLDEARKAVAVKP